MDKHYAIHIALLSVGGRYKEAHVQTERKEKCRGNTEPWNHLAREGIKIGRRRVFVEVHFQHSNGLKVLVLGYPHSKDIRSAAEVAHGAKISDSTLTAPSR